MANVPRTPVKLYRHPLSGHSHRVELLLSLLRVPYENVDVDLRAGEHKQPEFLAKNPMGQVPVIEDGDIRVADSNAILVYLAAKYGGDQWLPKDPVGLANIQRWLSFAAGPIAAGPAAARRANIFKVPLDHETAKGIAHGLFKVLDAELARTPFAMGGHATIADVAAYSYIAHAPEGDVDLSPYHNIRAWLARMEALPRFIPMKATPVGLAKTA